MLRHKSFNDISVQEWGILDCANIVGEELIKAMQELTETHKKPREEALRDLYFKGELSQSYQEIIATAVNKTKSIAAELKNAEKEVDELHLRMSQSKSRHIVDNWFDAIQRISEDSA